MALKRRYKTLDDIRLIQAELLDAFVDELKRQITQYKEFDLKMFNGIFTALNVIKGTISAQVDEELLKRARAIIKEKETEKRFGGGKAENLTKDLPEVTAEDLEGENGQEISN